MPLTRHLYAEDEVAAAFQWCLLRGSPVEATFWAMELLDSGMVDEFLRSLKRIWFFGFGIAALSWYKAFLAVEAAEELDATAAVGLVVSLSRIGKNRGKDISALPLLDSAQKAVRAGPSKYLLHLEGADSYFAASIFQGRAINAWRVFHAIRPEVVEEVAREKHGEAGVTCLQLLKGSPLLIAALCLPGGLAKRLSAPLPGMLSEVESSLLEWEGVIGRRARRAFPIPHQCLYLLTGRGKTSVYDSADSKLRGSLERPGKLWGSVYWDSVAEEYGGWEGIRNSSQQREAFYDTHFPDDIPDEWSLAERAKSHGIGSLQRGAEPCVKKFIQSWFGSIGSAVVWNPLEHCSVDYMNTEPLNINSEHIDESILNVRVKVVLVL